MYSKLPLVLDGVGEIPSITNSIPGLSIPSNFFGIRVPRGVPMEVVETMNMAWENVTMNSEALRAYSADRGALFNPAYSGLFGRLFRRIPAAHSGVIRPPAWVPRGAPLGGGVGLFKVRCWWLLLSMGCGFCGGYRR